MQLEDDPVALLGRRYAEIRSAIGGSEPLSVHDDLEEGEPDEHYGEAADGRWQCMLAADGTVETIFLFGDKGCRFPAGLRPGQSQAQVRAAMGSEPTMAKPAQEVPPLGWFGASMRWDLASHSMHAEFDDDGGLKQLTYMAAGTAP